MTTLVDAFHNDDIRKFEKILNKNEGRVMDDEFVKEHVSDLLRTLRTQVILNTFEPYTRIRLERISKDLNGIPIEDVESLLVSLILDEKLEGRIDQVSGILVKTNQSVGGGAASSRGDGKMASGSIQSRNTSSIVQLTAALEHLNGAISKASYVV
jgi:COP9 signalosome complex subunit 2